MLLEGFLVGSLGTWDPENDSLLTKLGITRKYGILFKKLCILGAILGMCGLPVVDVEVRILTTAPEYQIPVFTSLRRMFSLIGLLSSDLFPILPQGIARHPSTRVNPLHCGRVLS